MSQQRTRTISVDFRSPFYLKRVGTTLPAGDYDVIYNEFEMRPGSGWAILSCKMIIGPDILGPGDLGATADIDPVDLLEVYDKDKE